MYFLTRRSAFLALAAASIAFASLNSALAFFALEELSEVAKRGDTDMPVAEIIGTLLAVWLISLTLLILATVYGIRRTRRGYRYRFAGVIGASMAASVGLGALLHVTTVSERVNRYLTAHVPAYAKYAYLPYKGWNRPNNGYLGGAVLSVDNDHSLRLKDFSGREWTVDITVATIDTKDPLNDEDDVAIRGKKTAASEFKADSVESFD